MTIPSVLRMLSWLLLGTASAMLTPLVFAVGEGVWAPWLLAFAVTAILGVSLHLATPPAGRLDRRTGLAVVAFGWIAVALVGALPYAFSGVTTPLGAVFESVSGFTTTGATVFGNVEILPRSILWWRAISQWLGGLGVIVLGAAILPFVGVGGAQLFHSEGPEMSTEKLTLRIRSTARVLWGIYAGVTAVAGLSYWALGMPLFDSAIHAMTTAATGGFSTRNGSFSVYPPAIQWAAIVFMGMAATNLMLYHGLLTGRFRRFFSDWEWRAFAGLAVGGAVLAIWALSLERGAVTRGTIREAAFNVTAVLTTTGFHTADFAAWPVVCLVALVALMFVGAMGGSTGGGFKMVRVAVLAAHTFGALKRMLHPNAVVVSRFGNKPIRPDLLLNIVGLFVLFAGAHGLGTVVLSALGFDFLTATSASLSALSNVGPALGALGPTSNYADVPGVARIVLMALMLLGRLEFYALLILLVPETWSGARTTISRGGDGAGGPETLSPGVGQWGPGPTDGRRPRQSMMLPE